MPIKLLSFVLLIAILGATAPATQVSALLPSAAARQPSPATNAAAQTADAKHIELLGRLPGSSQAIAVQGVYAAVVSLNELFILNIADRAQPRAVSYLSLPGMLWDVAISGRYAYIAWGECGTEGPCVGGLQIVDITDPTVPAKISSLELSRPARRVSIIGSYAYLADDARLHIIDISRAGAPTEVAGVDISWINDMILLPGSATNHLYAYISFSASGSIQIVDLTNPVAPIVVGMYQAQGSFLNLAIVKHISTGKPYLYIADYDEQNPSLRVLDLSNPIQPAEVAAHPMPGRPTAVSITPHSALVRDSAGLHIFDTTHPDTPVETALMDIGGWGAAAIDAHIALLGAGDGLQVVDLTNLAAPKKIGAFKTIIPNGSVAGADHYLFVPGKNGLQIIDVLNPAAPAIVATFPTSHEVKHVALINTYALAIEEFNHISILDVANPSQPLAVGAYDIEYVGKSITDIAVAGTPGNGPGSAYAYIAWLVPEPSGPPPGGGVDVLDISNPAAPNRVASFAAPGAVASIAVSGQRAFLSSWSANNTVQSALIVLNIANPAQPTQVGALAIPGWARDMAVAGTYVSIATWDKGLAIVDVSNPAAPKAIGAYTQGGLKYAISVALAGKYAYVLDWIDYGQSKLHVVDITNPAAPTNITTSFMRFTSNNVATANGYVYVTNGLDGLSLFRHGRSNAGHVRDVLGRPVSGVMLSANGAAVDGTGLTGAYTLGNPSLEANALADVTLTPNLKGYTFWPPSRTIPSSGELRDQDFIVLPAPVSTTLDTSLSRTLSYTDTQGASAAVIFTQGTVAQTTTLTLTPLVAPAATNDAFAGLAFELTAARDGAALPDFILDQPALVSMHYSETGVRVISDESQLLLFWWNGSAWVDATTTCAPNTTYSRDPTGNVLSVSICRTGGYALLGPTNRMLMPIARG